jgi:isoquinoline 1-oxidoreductase alpha subunit
VDDGDKIVRVRLDVNGAPRDYAGPAARPLLWFLRDQLGLTGTKYGCGIGQCGACTVHLDGAAVRSCVVPMSATSKRKVRTIEGLGTPDRPHPVQQAWLEIGVSECGYCQPGQIMAAAAALAGPTPPPAQTLEDIGNICRCGTYARIGAAIALARARGASA